MTELMGARARYCVGRVRGGVRRRRGWVERARGRGAGPIWGESVLSDEKCGSGWSPLGGPGGLHSGRQPRPAAPVSRACRPARACGRCGRGCCSPPPPNCPRRQHRPYARAGTPTCLDIPCCSGGRSGSAGKRNRRSSGHRRNFDKLSVPERGAAAAAGAGCGLRRRGRLGRVHAALGRLQTPARLGAAAAGGRSAG